MGNCTQLRGMGKVDMARSTIMLAFLGSRSRGVEHVDARLEQRRIGSPIIRSLNWRTVMKNSVM
jgi:hypothetical protein